MAIRSLATILGAFTFVALAPAPLFSQAEREPDAVRCFAVEVEGDGPFMPEAVEMWLFRMPPGPTGEMPNVWSSGAPVRENVGEVIPAQWNVLVTELALQFEVWYGSEGDRRSLSVQFDPVPVDPVEADPSDPLELRGVPYRHIALPMGFREPADLPLDFVVHATETGCTSA